MNEFGNRLKKIRIEKNMSQKDFAARANIDKSMMCRYENGDKRPTYEALCSIAREHNISLTAIRNGFAYRAYGRTG